MGDCATHQTMRFQTGAALALEAAFDGGMLTSDGGLPLLADIDSELGVCEALAECVPEWRTGSARHSITDLVRQRVFQIASGYEDQNDANLLRSDPLLKLACGRLPEDSEDLASQPSLSRLENAPNRRALRLMAEALLELYIDRRAAAEEPSRVVLDFDSTDDPAHGSQEGVAYHGYFSQHQYHPLLVFDGETGQFVTAALRPGNAHAGAGSLAVLKRIVGKLRDRWPETPIEIRADAGFALPAVYEYCEREGILYTIGLIPNSRLEAMAEPLVAAASLGSLARMIAGEGHTKVRLLSEILYRAGSWERRRRVLCKVEILEKGVNTRFVVTNRPEPPANLYDGHYVMRGETENRIKDYKNALRAERLSCCAFLANQFRLFLHAAAYWLLDALRARLSAKGFGRMQLDTLRLMVVKIAGRVKQMAGEVRLYLSSAHPGQRLWRTLHAAAEPAHE